MPSIADTSIACDVGAGLVEKTRAGFSRGGRRHLHQHAGQSEWHRFGELVAPHGDLKAVAEVNVQDLAGVSRVAAAAA